MAAERIFTRGVSLKDMYRELESARSNLSEHFGDRSAKEQFIRVFEGVDEAIKDPFRKNQLIDYAIHRLGDDLRPAVDETIEIVKKIAGLSEGLKDPVSLAEKTQLEEAKLGLLKPRGDTDIILEYALTLIVESPEEEREKIYKEAQEYVQRNREERDFVERRNEGRVKQLAEVVKDIMTNPTGGEVEFEAVKEALRQTEVQKTENPKDFNPDLEEVSIILRREAQAIRRRLVAKVKGTKPEQDFLLMLAVGLNTNIKDHSEENLNIVIDDEGGLIKQWQDREKAKLDKILSVQKAPVVEVPAVDIAAVVRDMDLAGLEALAARHAVEEIPVVTQDAVSDEELVAIFTPEEIEIWRGLESQHVTDSDKSAANTESTAQPVGERRDRPNEVANLNVKEVLGIIREKREDKKDLSKLLKGEILSKEEVVQALQGRGISPVDIDKYIHDNSLERKRGVKPIFDAEAVVGLLVGARNISDADKEAVKNRCLIEIEHEVIGYQVPRIILRIGEAVTGIGFNGTAEITQEKLLSAGKIGVDRLEEFISGLEDGRFSADQVRIFLQKTSYSRAERADLESKGNNVVGMIGYLYKLSFSGISPLSQNERYRKAFDQLIRNQVKERAKLLKSELEQNKKDAMRAIIKTQRRPRR